MTKTTISDVIHQMTAGIESSLVTLVLGVLAFFGNELVGIAPAALERIAINFRTFVAAITAGTPWGEALAEMLTADWNEVEDDAKQIAVDFAEALGKILQRVGVAKA